MRTLRDIGGTAVIAGVAAVLAGVMIRWSSDVRPTNEYLTFRRRMGVWVVRCGVALVVVGVPMAAAGAVLS